MYNPGVEISKLFIKRYRIALGVIAFFVITGQILIQRQIYSQVEDGRTIELASRQAILAQKLVKFILLKQNEPTKQGIEELRINQKTLLGANYDSSIKKDMGKAGSTLKSLLDCSSCLTESVCYECSESAMITRADAFTEQMGIIITALKIDHDKKVSQLIVIEAFFFIFTLICIGSQITFVFLPMVKQLTQAITFSLREKGKNERLASLVDLGKIQSTIGHELKMILDITKIQAEHLTKELVGPQKERADQIYYASEQMAKVIDMIRMMARKERTELSEMKATALLEDIKMLHIMPLKSSGISFEIISNEINSLYCNKVNLLQVIGNLISNSRFAVAKLKDQWIRVELSKVDAGIQITVTDSGNGIPTHVVPHLFEAFFTTKPDSQGTGIGLDLSKKIIEDQHQGKIYYNSHSPYTQFVIILHPTAESFEKHISEASPMKKAA